jgi:hypothetical protein
VADFEALAATAKRLVDANGRQVTLIKHGKNPQSGDQPWRGEATYPEAQVSGIAAFVTSTLLLTWKIRTESNVKSGASYALFPAVDDEGHQLEYFDELRDGSTVWRIASVEVLGPADTRLLYLIEVVR